MQSFTRPLIALSVLASLLVVPLIATPAVAQYKPPEQDDSNTYDGKTDSSSWSIWTNY